MNVEMNQSELIDKDVLLKRILFLQEIISEKIIQFNELIESIKRHEGHSIGSKELIEKVSDHIKKQQVVVGDMVSQQQTTLEISNFINIILENVKLFVNAVCGDAEKLYFFKQGELMFLKQEIEKLNKLKLEYEQKVEVLDKERLNKEESCVNDSATDTLKENTKKSKEASIEGSTPVDGENKLKKRIRPDQDPNTRAGRAALDLVARRKKHEKKLS